MKWFRTTGIFVFGAVAIFAVLLPLGTVVAQPPGGIVSCSDPAGIGSVSCNICSMVTLGQNIINFAILIAMPIAMLLFAWAGFLYFTSGFSSAQITTAHSIFKKTAIGFVAVLVAWLVVNTVILQVIVKNNAGYFSDVGGTWYKVPQCSGARETNKMVKDLLGGIFAPGRPDTTTPPPGPGDKPNPGFAYDTYCKDSRCSSDEANLALDVYNSATEHDVTWYPTASLDVNRALLSDVVTQVGRAGTGDVNINSGTDGTHSPGSLHYSGEAIDIGGGTSPKANPRFDAYVRGWPKIDGFGSETYRDPYGYVWNFEGNHWHVSKSGR